MNTAGMLNSSENLSRLLYVVYKRNVKNGMSGISCLANKAYYVWGKRTLRKMEP